MEDTTIDRVVDDTTTGTTEDGDSVDGTTEEEEEEEEVTVGTGIEIEIDDGTMGTTGVDRGTVGTEIGIGIIGGITAVGDRGSVVAALVAAALVEEYHLAPLNFIFQNMLMLILNKDKDNSVILSISKFIIHTLMQLIYQPIL